MPAAAAPPTATATATTTTTPADAPRALPEPPTARKDARLVCYLLLAIGVPKLIALVEPAFGQLQFLKKCLDATKTDTSTGVQFTQIVNFFNNLHDGILGISLPAGTCALIAGCVLWGTGQIGRRTANALFGGGLIATIGVLLIPGLLA